MRQRLVRLFRCGLTRNTRKFAAAAFPRNMSTQSRYFPNPYLNEDDEGAFNTDDVSKRLKKDWQKILDKIVQKQPAESANPEGGLYVGNAGIAYAFMHASQRLSANEASSTAKDYLSLAQRYLEPSLRDLDKRGNRVDCSFLLGDGGVVAVGAVLALKAGDIERSNAFSKRYVDMAELCKPVNFLKSHGSDEFFVGRAGYLFGSLWLNKQLGRIVVPIDKMHELARSIIISGNTYARKHNSPCPLMYAYYDTEYLGAAHGLASILQVLIQVPGFLDTDKEAENLVQACVDYFLSVETSSGNYPCALDEIDASGRNSRGEAKELVHWCHGAPGVVYLFAAAFLRWRDPRYLDACQRAADLVWRKGLLKKGPSICHGVAGNGYVFLLLYRLTSDTRYLRRAAKFADFINTEDFERGARTPDSPYSLYEGIAGTACFLADVTQPDEASFPFQDVF